jgi:uncharacterized glyoxalase superfamily protein PhnB
MGSLRGQERAPCDLSAQPTPFCYIITADADAWHARLVTAGLAVTPIVDAPWGTHEFTLRDPGNNIRIGRNASSDQQNP